MERYLRVNLLGPSLRIMKKEFTGSRSQRLRDSALGALAPCGEGDGVLVM